MALSQAALAKEVLAEIPDQFLSYMKKHNIKPKLSATAPPWVFCFILKCSNIVFKIDTWTFYMIFFFYIWRLNFPVYLYIELNLILTIF